MASIAPIHLQNPRFRGNRHSIRNPSSRKGTYGQNNIIVVLKQNWTTGKLLTLGAHAQEGYCSCLVCVCVCLSVTTLAATSFVFTLKSRYVGVCYRLFLDLTSWIFEKTFHSKVMAWKSQYANEGSDTAEISYAFREINMKSRLKSRNQAWNPSETHEIIIEIRCEISRNHLESWNRSWKSEIRTRVRKFVAHELAKPWWMIDDVPS